MQEDPLGRMTLEQPRHELAGQRLDPEEGHEHAALECRLGIGGNTHSTALAHLAHDTDDALAGGGRHLVAQLGPLSLQEFVHRLLLGWAVEDDRRALAAVPVVEHFPVAQVTGDADHTLAGGQGLIQQMLTLHLADQSHGPGRVPIQAQALSAKLRPILTRVSPTSRSRCCSDSSGKQWRRLVRTTSRERFGSFHMSQPTKAPTRCAAPNGSRANSLSDPTTIAPLSFSTEHTPFLQKAPL